MVFRGIYGSVFLCGGIGLVRGRPTLVRIGGWLVVGTFTTYYTLFLPLAQGVRRHASRLLEGDVPEHYVQEVLGHANLGTTSRYLATTRKGLHQAMERYEQCVQTRVDFPEKRGPQGRQRPRSMTPRPWKPGLDASRPRLRSALGAGGPRFEPGRPDQ